MYKNASHSLRGDIIFVISDVKEGVQKTLAESMEINGEYLPQIIITDNVGGNINQQVQLGNNLANGMYLLNLRSATETSVFHFVIEQ